MPIFNNQRICFLRLLVTAFLFFPGITPLMAATFYVDQAHELANDLNTGTETKPWKTIQKAASTLQAGETVYVKAGIYQELYSGPPDTAYTALKPQNSGQPGNYISYIAYPGDTVVIDQQMQATIIRIESKSYIKISGFELRNGRGGIVTTGTANNIIIENNIIHNIDTVSGANNGGIYFTPCSYCEVRNNVIYDVFVNGTNIEFQDGANGSAVHSYNMEFVTIENNEFYNVYNGVFHKSSSGRKGALIRANLIHDVTRALFYDVAGSGDQPHINQEIVGNIIYNVKYGIGLAAGSGDLLGQVNDGLKIWNNVIVASNSAIGVVNAINVEIFNNIVVGDAGVKSDGFGHQDGTSINYLDNNIYFNIGRWVTDLYTQGVEKYYFSFSSWQSGSGFDANSYEVDPDFSRIGINNYHITQGSELKGRFGQNIGAYATGNEVVGPTTGILLQIRPKPPTGLN